MKTGKDTILEILKKLPPPLVGSLAFDSREKMNLRESCLDMVNEVLDMASPKEILEFGTHLGHSSALWLSLSSANVTSVDIGTGVVEWEHGYNDYHCPRSGGGQKDVVAVLTKEFPNRFRFFGGSSYAPETIAKFSDRKYGLVFIDGDHMYEGVSKDIATAIKLEIPYILIDDCSNRFNNEEQVPTKAAREGGLVFVKDYFSIHNTGNIGCKLFKPPGV